MKNFEFAELARRLANLVRAGTVHEVRHKPYAVRVKSGNLITTWLPPLVHRAGNNRSWAPLEVGEQVVILSADGELAQGFVLASGYTDVHSAPSADPEKTLYTFGDGAVIEYDREQHHLKAVLPHGSTTELVSTGGITLAGDLTVNGNIHSTQNISDSTRSMAADRAIYNGHTHSGVLPGKASSGSTEAKQ